MNQSFAKETRVGDPTHGLFSSHTTWLASIMSWRFRAQYLAGNGGAANVVRFIPTYLHLHAD
jgi:hypothetical protein